MIQTGSLPLNALIAEIETQYLVLLEANASKAAEIAALKAELDGLKKTLELRQNQPTETV